jgi:cyclomaltodextrinase / maltogenic alpha-amylase / neopullulanase
MDLLFGDLSTNKGRERYSRKQLCGFQHDCRIRRQQLNSEAAVEIQAFVGSDINILSAFVAYTTDGSSPAFASDRLSCQGISFISDTVRVVEMTCRQTTWHSLDWSYCQVWSALIPESPAGTLVQYSLAARLSDGRLVACPYPSAPKDSSASVYGYYNDEVSGADWLKEAIIYQIIPDRFCAGGGRQFAQAADLAAICGGTLNGITEKLEYLRELGINCIWLTPIFPSPSHHGYDATDYEGIEPRLGILDEFRLLSRECRRRSIKLLLDFPANHVSSDHPFFVDAVQDPQSKYFSWFKFKRWPDEYDCYYGLSFMPILNCDNPEVRDYLIKEAIRWLDEGADGYRLDHAHGLSHLFWSHFRHAVRAVHKNAVMIAEVTSAPDKILSYEGRMDGCLDFKAAELLRRYYGIRAMAAGEFAAQLERHLDFASPGMLNPSFLDNHDMNRFLFSVKGDLRNLKLAALCQFMLPGPPIIYYGTEVGLSQNAPCGRLEQSRLPMPWGCEQDGELLAFYRSLIALRKTLMAGGMPVRRLLATDDERSLVIMQIGTNLFVSNNGPHWQRIDNLCTGSSIELKLTTDSRVRIRDGRIELPPYTGAVLSAGSKDAAGRFSV